MAHRWWIGPVTGLAGVVALAACGRAGGDQGRPADAPPAAASAATSAAKRNACALFDKADLETIAGRPLELLHDIEADDHTTCEVRAAGESPVLVYVKVSWTGGKEAASINRMATGMAKGLLNDKDTDIEALTGSGEVKGLADQAYYSDLMPSWALKGDVMIEILSPQFGHDQTRAVFLAVIRKALTRL
jgi:hypothetical protein